MFANNLFFRLPDDGNGNTNFRFMPAMANGHIGFVPYRPYVHIRGLYNGEGGMSNPLVFTICDCFLKDTYFFLGNSHRAEVPNIAMGKVSTSGERINRRDYKFNALDGMMNTSLCKICLRP